MSKRKTNEEFIAKLNNVNSNIIALDRYINNHTKIRFQCKKCGYIWKTVPASIISSRTGCPKCAGTMKKENLEFINLLKKKNPNVIVVDEYINNKTKIKFQCKKCGHIWKALPSNINKGHGCPNCNRRMGTSMPEQAIYFYVHLIYPEAINGYKTYRNNEFDIYIPSIKTAIEYDGINWHKNKIIKDKEKYNYCKENGIFLIRIREDNLSNYELSQLCDFYIHSDYEDNNHKLEDIDESIVKLVKHFQKILDINTSRDRLLIEEQYFEKQRKDSLLFNYPIIAEEWNQDKNGNITPDMVGINSNKKYSWKCKECGFVWEATISNRCNKQTKCPKCSNRMRLAHSTFLKRLEEKNKNFKNIIFLSEYYNQKTKISCKCKKCGYVWDVKPSGLMSGHGCPKCAGNLKLSHEEFIEKLYQHNNNIKCTGRYAGIDCKTEFKCMKCGYIWKTTPYVILNGKKGNGCPKCSKVVKKTNEDFLEELHSIHPNVVPLNEYEGANKEMKFRCEQCGNIWISKPHNILMVKEGRGCPKCSRSNARRILCIEKNIEFDNLTKALEFCMGKSKSCLINCCKGKTKTAYGYHWKYLE